MTFSAVHCASLILGLEGNWTTYKTVSLNFKSLMDWISAGCKFEDSTTIPMNVVQVQDASNNRRLTATNSVVDFLLRGKTPSEPITALGAYAFASFYEKVDRKDLARDGNPNARGPIPHERVNFDDDHPETGTKYLKRVKYALVPKLLGSVPRRPEGWPSTDDAAANSDSSADVDCEDNDPNLPSYRE
eukprot:scaffold245247_cov17-Prasinocladus_malaysianus.AAC.1